jgi:hypothetical protein
VAKIEDEEEGVPNSSLKTLAFLRQRDGENRTIKFVISYNIYIFVPDETN